MKLAVYITCPGNTREVMTFYQQVFKCKEPYFMPYGVTPMKDQTPDVLLDKIMHSSLEINPYVTIMACDDHKPACNEPASIRGDHIQISLVMNDRKETERLFAELSNGGSKIGPLSDMFWGGYFGHCTDKFGTKWMFNCENPSKDGKRELQEAAANLREVAVQATKSAEALEILIAKDAPSGKE